MPTRRRFLRVTVVIVGVIGLLVGSCIVVLRHPRPEGTSGPAADALAHRIEQSVHRDAWDRTLAVRWTFGGRHHHLWDRERQLARVRFGKVEVLIDLTSKDGQVTEGGAEVIGEGKRRLLDKAYAYWINDSFWLNPLAKLFDPGVTRSVVKGEDGQEGLMISYGGGGLTPGDSYLWLLSPDGVPRAWRMWVSIIPIPGLEASWDGWTTLPTGALVSTNHRIGFVPLKLTDVAAAAKLADLESGPDPFAAISRR